MRGGVSGLDVYMCMRAREREREREGVMDQVEKRKLVKRQRPIDR